jgi:hypothetical protein
MQLHDDWFSMHRKLRLLMVVRVWCASFLFALPRRSRQPPATVRSPALYDDQVLARCRGLSCIRNCFQFHSASVKGYTVICPMPSDVSGFCQPCTRARTVLQLSAPGLMPLLPLPSSILVESLLPWLHAGSVFRLATTARFDDPLLATFTSQARTALQELPTAFEDVLLTGMNVPVFEHRRVPRLILVPSAPEQATTAEKVRAFAAIRYNLLEERPGEFERHMLQAWMSARVDRCFVACALT